MRSRTAIASALLFTISHLVIAPFSSCEALDRTPIRPIYRVALRAADPDLALGGSELELKRRLALLREIGNAMVSRAGVAAPADATLRRLLRFFGPYSALLAVHPSSVDARGLLFASAC